MGFFMKLSMDSFDEIFVWIYSMEFSMGISMEFSM